MKSAKKIFVGMSGGVDSSVSAALLKKEGHDVTGVFIKVWQPDFLPCSWKEERREAMKVAAYLDIPFITLDLEKEYKKEVVDYMIAEYKKGRTPNPDVMCNKHVKFGAFFKYAMKAGAEFIATGHYARTFEVPTLTSKKNEMGSDPKKERRVKLVKGKDENKDQSYFLWTLTQKELSRTLFPVGNMEKHEVRRLAKKFGLPNAEKKDSQGLCFIGKIDMKEFLGHYISQTEGDVLNTEGDVIGTHQGARFYTLGERHGFLITEKRSEGEAYFVTAKDIQKNSLTVAHIGALEIKKNIIIIERTNWIGGIPDPRHMYTIKVRYQGKLLKAKVNALKKNIAKITFTSKVESVASGQSIVVYKGEVCVGGGIVK